MPNPVRLSDLTTLRLGGPAPELITVSTPQEVVAVIGAADRAGTGVLILGGGSNLVVADAGIDIPIVRIAIPGIRIEPDPARPGTAETGTAERGKNEHGTAEPDPPRPGTAETGTAERGTAETGTAERGTDEPGPYGPGTADTALVTIGAGENWDAVVAELTAQGFAELAPMSGIPGSTGATPVQNVGAYGSEIADVLVAVTLYDRATGTIKTATAEELQLAYRSSTLRGTDSAVITDIQVRLTRGPVVIRYAELARALGVQPGDTAPPASVRDAVLKLRRSKGMVLDPDDPDTFSAGSFFTNPILDPAQAEQADAAIKRQLGQETSYPRYPVAGRPDAVKLSAAWLIDKAGFTKGYPGPDAKAALSTKHTLALTNRGGSTADLLALAREIRDGVENRFAVTLHPEPLLIGVRLDA